MQPARVFLKDQIMSAKIASLVSFLCIASMIGVVVFIFKYFDFSPFVPLVFMIPLLAHAINGWHRAVYHSKNEDAKLLKIIINEQTGHTKYSATWPIVFRFSMKLEAKLEEHRMFKGDREGWLYKDPTDLYNQLAEQYVDFGTTLNGRETPDYLWRKAASVGVLAMMVADCYEDECRQAQEHQDKHAK